LSMALWFLVKGINQPAWQHLANTSPQKQASL
jgi:hypothetical protein